MRTIGKQCRTEVGKKGEGNLDLLPKKKRCKFAVDEN